MGDVELQTMDVGTGAERRRIAALRRQPANPQSTSLMFLSGFNFILVF